MAVLITESKIVKEIYRKLSNACGKHNTSLPAGINCTLTNQKENNILVMMNKAKSSSGLHSQFSTL